MKTTTAFAAFAARRKSLKTATATHAVYAIKKSGGLYAQPHETFTDEAAADKYAARLIALNPGKNFVVKAN